MEHEKSHALWVEIQELTKHRQQQADMIVILDSAIDCMWNKYKVLLEKENCVQTQKQKINSD